MWEAVGMAVVACLAFVASSPKETRNNHLHMIITVMLLPIGRRALESALTAWYLCRKNLYA
jgi:hypothetical protein